MQPAIEVRTPGKIILSGEHAVVYQKPALALAVNRYLTTTVRKQNRSQILFDFADLADKHYLNVTTLRSIKARIKRKYQRFIAGEYSIRQVLQKPFELGQYTLSLFAETMRLILPQGMHIHVTSTIPMGCGMGSSAATIVGIMHAIAHYLHLQVTDETLFNLAHEAENAQHGRSSGLDIHMASRGGCQYFENGKIVARPVPTMPLYLINTGKPQTSTGECVSVAAEHFHHATLADDFAAVTKMMDASLQEKNLMHLIEAVRLNHRLLTRIDVVPKAIQHFIADIEMRGGAAKICGAGAVRGDAAGMVWVLLEDDADLPALCRDSGFELLRIAAEAQGACRVYGDE